MIIGFVTTSSSLRSRTDSQCNFFIAMKVLCRALVRRGFGGGGDFSPPYIWQVSLNSGRFCITIAMSGRFPSKLNLAGFPHFWQVPLWQVQNLPAQNSHFWLSNRYVTICPRNQNPNEVPLMHSPGVIFSRVILSPHFVEKCLINKNW